MNEYDQNFWEERWSQVLRERSDRVAQRPPNAHLTADLTDLPRVSRDPGVHRFSYERMGAQVTEIEGGSHVVMISHPKEVATVVTTALHTCAVPVA